MLYESHIINKTVGIILIRFILLWLGWAFIIVGSAKVVYQLFIYSQMYQELQKDALKLFNSRLFGIRDGIVHLALGAIMVGVYELLLKADMQNVTQLKPKKDLGNWAPSI